MANYVLCNDVSPSLSFSVCGASVLAICSAREQNFLPLWGRFLSNLAFSFKVISGVVTAFFFRPVFGRDALLPVLRLRALLRETKDLFIFKCERAPFVFQPNIKQSHYHAWVPLLITFFRNAIDQNAFVGL